MYVPRHFAEENPEGLVELVRENNFGALVTVIDGAPYATHLPFLISFDDNDGIVLSGHVAKQNPHWKFLEQGRSMAIFQGPHAYISPTWYNTPGVPTWNYAAVHLSGKPNLVTDQSDIYDIVIALSDQHEADNPTPWVPDFSDSMLSAIVGFTMKAELVEGKYKLSQNRPEQDKDRLIDALKSPFGQPPSENQVGIAKLMKAAFKNT
ncbi:MAG: FMN-binding negative transcriptional regulator [bacterium]